MAMTGGNPPGLSAQETRQGPKCLDAGRERNSANEERKFIKWLTVSFRQGLSLRSTSEVLAPMTWFWLNISLAATSGREVGTMLTGKWVTADDGALVMQWTEQRREDKPEQKSEEMTIAA